MRQGPRSGPFSRSAPIAGYRANIVAGFSANIDSDRIAERISEGENIIQIAQDADMPSKRSILRWARKNEHFKPLYREAMELKADLYHHKADEALRHAKDPALPMTRPRFFSKPRIWFSRSRLILTNWARLFRTARTA